MSYCTVAVTVKKENVCEFWYAFFIALLKSKSEFADIIKIIKRSMKKEFLYYCFEKQIKIHRYSKNHQILKTQYERRLSYCKSTQSFSEQTISTNCRSNNHIIMLYNF